MNAFVAYWTAALGMASAAIGVAQGEEGHGWAVAACALLCAVCLIVVAVAATRPEERLWSPQRRPEGEA